MNISEVAVTGWVWFIAVPLLGLVTFIVRLFNVLTDLLRQFSALFMLLVLHIYFCTREKFCWKSNKLEAT